MRLRAIPFALAVAVTAAVAADARVALEDDPTIENGLTIVAIGNYLRRGCPTIEARAIRAYSFIYSLQRRARSLGYTNEEIDAYTESPEDQARVEAKAKSYLTARGADFDNREETFCDVGKAEIEANTAVGRLLKVNGNG